MLTDPLTLFEGIYKEHNLHIWSKISKRSLWDTNLRFPEGRVMEDMVVTPRLALRIGWNKNQLYCEYLKRSWFLRLRRFALEH